MPLWPTAAIALASTGHILKYIATAAITTTSTTD